MQIFKFHPTGVSLLVVSSFATIAALLAASVALPLSAATSSSEPNFGQSVYVFNPSMSLSTIQATVDAVASEQVSNQFGTQRYALLFEPGTYGSSATPLIFQVGYYTTVAGLGLSPSDVTINGEINVSNQCLGPGNCTALVNFWRSLSNLTINVTSTSNCTASAEFWAVSQAAPIRRVQINGNLFLFDYCSDRDSRVAGSLRIHSSPVAPLLTRRSSSGSPGTAILMDGPMVCGTRCSQAS